MAGSQKSFSWNADTLTKNLSRLPLMLERMIIAATEYHGTRGEAYMRKNAKWTDRTSNARNSLTATVSHTATQHTIVLAHGMSYGIWLEVRWAGRYAIVTPAIPIVGRDLMSTLNKGMARLG